MTLFDTHVVATFGKRFQGLVENAKPGSGTLFAEFCQTYEYSENQIRLPGNT